MEELIRITEHDGKRAVSARELHQFLGSKQQFTDWIKARVKKYDLVENIDFEVIHNFMKNPEGGRPLDEYALTIDCAKELAMVEGNAKGKLARHYFIACEKKLKEVSKPLSQLEIIAQSAQILLEQDKRLSNVEEKVKEIEAKTQTRPNFFTIVGYGTLHGVSVNLKQASSLGRKASDLCKLRGITTDTIPDPRFGTVKMYPESVLNEVFSNPLN